MVIKIKFMHVVCLIKLLIIKKDTRKVELSKHICVLQ